MSNEALATLLTGVVILIGMMLTLWRISVVNKRRDQSWEELVQMRRNTTQRTDQLRGKKVQRTDQLREEMVQMRRDTTQRTDQLREEMTQRMAKLEAGQQDLAKSVSRVEGILEGMRQPKPWELAETPPAHGATPT